MLSTKIKNAVLASLAGALERSRVHVISTNKQDLDAYAGADEAMHDRLVVDDKKVDAMIAALEEGIALPDPEGDILYTFEHPNGMRLENRSVPFGRILIIYESRPDVTIEAALTAFKAGNRILLKGGKEARQSNMVLTELWQEALKANGVSETYVAYLDFSREQTQKLIRENTHNLDLIIPRGGEALIDFVRNNTDVPVIVSGRGNNFLYVDRDADIDMAIELVLNGKSRISVCNAIDKVLVDMELPGLGEKVHKLVSALQGIGVEVVGGAILAAIDKRIHPVSKVSVLPEEFLAARIYIGLSSGLQEAVHTINKYSGKHSAAIVTSDSGRAERFMEDVDCAAVYHNASTRFTDGGQFGFGAEIAISTQKMHFRGPIGMGQLVTNKWFVYGNGQTRG